MGGLNRVIQYPSVTISSFKKVGISKLQDKGDIQTWKKLGFQSFDKVGEWEIEASRGKFIWSGVLVYEGEMLE